MIKVRRLGYVLSLIGIATAMGSEPETASEYVAPSQAIPRGKAPKMQVEMVSRAISTKQYVVIFYQGDEAFYGQPSRGSQ